MILVKSPTLVVYTYMYSCITPYQVHYWYVVVHSTIPYLYIYVCIHMILVKSPTLVAYTCMYSCIYISKHHIIYITGM